jgi:hypothetical protein
MKSRCTKEDLLRHIKAQIKRQHETKTEFAASCGQTAQNLNSAMNSASLPDWLIERFGYRKVTVYERVK